MSLSISLSLSLFHSFTHFLFLTIYLSIYLSTYLSLSLFRRCADLRQALTENEARSKRAETRVHELRDDVSRRRLFAEQLQRRLETVGSIGMRGEEKTL